MSEKIMQKSNKSNPLKDLILLFAIPVGIAIFAAAVIYFPKLLANPKSDFVYSLCSSYDCRDSYNVDSAGYVSKESADSSNLSYYSGASTLRYYDAAGESTRSLTLAEAQRYRLDSSSKSPDGYSLVREETSSGFLFWGDYNAGWYLKNGTKQKKVELSSNVSYDSRDIKFLGWVEK